MLRILLKVVVKISETLWIVLQMLQACYFLLAGNMKIIICRNLWNDTISKEQAMGWRTIKNASILSAMASLMQIISIVLLLYLGSKGLITAGDFAFIFILSLTIINQMVFLTENLDSCAEQIGVCNQALKILSQEHEQKTPKDATITNRYRNNCI